MKFTRRDFLRYSFMATAVTALAGCGRPVEHYLLSQYPMPEYMLPGNPVYFATSCGPYGIAVKCIEGRAIKMEGLPGHPVNMGKLSAEIQVAIESHYHPERLIQPMQGTKSTSWELAQDPLKQALAQPGGLFIVDKLSGSKGTFLLTVAKAIGARVWVLQYPSFETDRGVMKALTGKAELPYYPIEQADYILNFGSDFLVHNPLAIRYNWAYGEFRQGRNRERGVMVSISSHMNLSCANADRWLPCRPGSEGMVAAALGTALGATRSGWSGGNVTLEQANAASGIPVDLLKRLVARLQKAKKPLVIAGPDGSFDAGAISAMHNLNRLLTGSNPTCEVDLLPSLAGQAADPSVLVSTREALEGFDSNKWQSVFVIDSNPAYVMASVKLADKLKNVKSKVAFSLFQNETTALCDLVLPSRTWLEEWNDCLVEAPFGKVYNVAQPVVKPRSDTRAVTDSLLAAMRAAKIQFPFSKAPSFRDLLRQGLGDRFEAAVVRGGLWEPVSMAFERYPHPVSTPPPSLASPGGAVPTGVSAWSGLQGIVGGAPVAPPLRGQAKGVLLAYPTVKFGDGSRANSPWMQELPDPMTTVAWASWIEINPFSEIGKGVKRGDLLEISANGVTIKGPAFPTQAVQVDAIAIPAGNGHARNAYGSRYTDQVATPMNPLALLVGTAGNPWAPTEVSITNTKKVQFIATFDRRVMGLEKHTLPHH